MHGNLLDQGVDIIVNAWNRNLIPWWLLLPQGVSGAIKREAGREPFRELDKHGIIPLGAAVLTGAGRLGYKGIIHVAGINLLWLATKYSIQKSVISAMNIVNEKGFGSIAFPIIGSGSGSRSRRMCLAFMMEAFSTIESKSRVVVVEYRGKSKKQAS